MDNDVYVHVNNVVYYSYFDTVIHNYLIASGGLEIATGPVIGLCIASRCEYKHAVAYPDELDVGFRAAKIGRTSVTYELAIFKDGAPELCAAGSFVHVFVDREHRRPTPIPKTLRSALERIAAKPSLGT